MMRSAALAKTLAKTLAKISAKVLAVPFVFVSV